MDIQFQIINGARGTIIFFIVATVITNVLFEQFLILAGVHSRQRMVMDASLSDIIEARATIANGGSSRVAWNNRMHVNGLSRVGVSS